MGDWRRVAVAVSMMCVGCASEALDEVRQRTDSTRAPQNTDSVRGEAAPIVSGAREMGQRAVVAILRDGGICTGTIIGPYAVLTAKHCVFEGRTPVGAEAFRVYVGDDLRTSGSVESVHSVAAIRSTPGTDLAADIRDGNDVAVILLDAALSVPPLTPSTSEPAVGDFVTIVGFGRTMTGRALPSDNGVKYIGAANIVDVRGNLIEAAGSSTPCEGDSGGPLIDSSSGEVVGVTSFGVDSRCVTPNAFYSRVDVHLDLIADALTFVPDCTASMEVCDGRDNDCNGRVDEGCTPLGDVCTEDAECTGGDCAMVFGARVCVRACDPTSGLATCPSAFYCEATACGVGRCVAGSPGGGEPGAPCAADSDCASLSCADAGGTMRCGRSCTLDTDPCAVGEVCEGAASADCGACIPAELSTGPRGFGAPCDTNDQCIEDRCDERICTHPCPCPNGFHCRQGLCRRGEPGGPGSPCLDDEDCGVLAPDCPDVGGDKVCAPECGPDGLCPADLECSATPIGERCIAPGLPLGESCESNDECRSRSCDRSVCSRVCDDFDPCPEGFACVMEQCFFRATAIEEPEGGCSAVGGGPAPGEAVLVGLVALLLLQRRRARG